MMESFYLTDTKPLPFVCHPLFAHSSVIHYMFFYKCNMSTNTYGTFFYLIRNRLCTNQMQQVVSKHAHLTKNKIRPSS